MLYYFFAITKIKLDIQFFFSYIVKKKNYHKIGQSKYKNTVSWTDFYSISVFHREKSKEKFFSHGEICWFENCIVLLFLSW